MSKYNKVVNHAHCVRWTAAPLQMCGFAEQNSTTHLQSHVSRLQRRYKTREVMCQKLAVFLLLFSPSVWCVTPEIHSVTYKSGAAFYHFEVELTKGNFLLPKDFPSREQLDDKSENFKYGQFEIFIPASNLELPMRCKTNYIARMPQTLGEGEILIKEKQSLYTTLSDVYQGKIKSVSVVFEMPYKTECNIFFRTSKGKYIDYVGTVK